MSYSACQIGQNVSYCLALILLGTRNRDAQRPRGVLPNHRRELRKVAGLSTLDRILTVITEMNTIHWVLFGIQNRTLGPYFESPRQHPDSPCR
jgi:hypothetical protein